jgi:hypothetical protein
MLSKVACFCYLLSLAIVCELYSRKKCYLLAFVTYCHLLIAVVDGCVPMFGSFIQEKIAKNILNLALSDNCLSFMAFHKALQSKVQPWLYINMHNKTKLTTPTNTLATFIHLFNLCCPAMLLTSTL